LLLTIHNYNGIYSIIGLILGDALKPINTNNNPKVNILFQLKAIEVSEQTNPDDAA